jgi:hypothetical protein
MSFMASGRTYSANGPEEMPPASDALPAGDFDAIVTIDDAIASCRVVSAPPASMPTGIAPGLPARCSLVGGSPIPSSLPNRRATLEARLSDQSSQRLARGRHHRRRRQYNTPTVAKLSQRQPLSRRPLSLTVSVIRPPGDVDQADGRCCHRAPCRRVETIVAAGPSRAILVTGSARAESPCSSSTFLKLITDTRFPVTYEGRLSVHRAEAAKARSGRKDVLEMPISPAEFKEHLMGVGPEVGTVQHLWRCARNKAGSQSGLTGAHSDDGGSDHG